MSTVLDPDTTTPIVPLTETRTRQPPLYRFVTEVPKRKPPLYDYLTL